MFYFDTLSLTVQHCIVLICRKLIASGDGYVIMYVHCTQTDLVLLEVLWHDCTYLQDSPTRLFTIYLSGVRSNWREEGVGQVPKPIFHK